MDNILLLPHQNKRGAIDYLGNIVNSLFDILEPEYTKKISNLSA